jgi:D-alanine-D-alanine ligase
VTARKPRIVVLFGGRSTEHGISCVTGGSVLAAIDHEQYDVVPVGIAQDGCWVLETGDLERMKIKDRQVPSVDATLPPVTLAQADGGTELVVHEASGPRSLGHVDAVFPLLHGPWGEDGTLQGQLEMAGVRYVGAGVLASAVSMDKGFMKVALAAAGVPVMPSIVVTAREWARDAAGCRSRSEELGYPLFVKPARGGSSIGISKVHDASELDAAIATAMEHDPRVLVEGFAADAREIECGVLQMPDGEIRTSLPAEIRIGGDHEFYDFEAKYLPGEHTEIDCPAKVDDALLARMQEIAVATFEAVACEGLARVDFFAFPDGSLVVNELNTMPGFTPSSMYPQMWGASGVGYTELVDLLIQQALGRSTGLR